MLVSELSGQLVGNGEYYLLVRLGGGNFGTVYRAEQRMGNMPVREVALKLYSPEATREGKVEGMLQDCSLPARIMASEAPIEQKRHFVQIYSFGRMDTPAGECAYVSMELVRGGDTLEDLIKRCKRIGRYPREEVIVDYMRQFFSALQLAHEANVLHRDIKGANVMLVDGVIRVLDFGMGADLDKPETALKTTISIFAPENFDGRYTAASDIYQAGLMFYQLYTGFQPFEDRFGSEGMLAERKKRLDFTFRPGSSFPGAQPSELLDAVISRCLSYAELARFATPADVVKALDRVDELEVMEQTLALGDAEQALVIAGRCLEQRGQSDERIIRALRGAAKANSTLGRLDEAIPLLRKALDTAEKSGVFFHAPQRYNQLLDDIALCYIKKGQGGMARIYAAKKKK